jgi:soluble lytic murein transglycosylase-like protein
MSVDPRMMADYIRLQMMGGTNLFSDSLYGDANVYSTPYAGGSTAYNSYADPFSMFGASETNPDSSALGLLGSPLGANEGTLIPASKLLQNLRPLQGPLGYENLLAASRARVANAGSVSPLAVANTSRTSAPTQSSQYNTLIEQASKQFGVSASLIKAVIQAESGFNAKAVSPAGARGLMQLMPRTAASLGVSDSFDVNQNITGGTKYLSQMLRRFNGEEAVALAAYNAGPGRISGLGISNTEELREKFLLLPRETQKYVDKVLAFKRNYE